MSPFLSEWSVWHWIKVGSLINCVGFLGGGGDLDGPDSGDSDKILTFSVLSSTDYYFEVCCHGCSCWWDLLCWSHCLLSTCDIQVHQVFCDMFLPSRVPVIKTNMDLSVTAKVKCCWLSHYCLCTGTAITSHQQWCPRLIKKCGVELFNSMINCTNSSVLK